MIRRFADAVNVAVERVQMAVLKRILIVLAVLLLIPIAAVAAAFAYATTDSGLATIARLVSTYGSSEDAKIGIGRIEGSFPTDLTIRDIRLADREGQWLAIDRARVAWSPLDLFSRRLTINLVDVGRVDVARAPIIPPSREPEQPSDPDAPLIPDLPIEIRLDRFLLDDLNLAEPVLGVPARLAASASVALRDAANGLSGEFDVRRTDGAAGRVTGRARFVPSTEAIQISLRGGEPAGGLIARLAQIPGLPPVDIGIEGSGTLDAIRTQLVVTAGDRGRIDGAVELRREGEARRVTLGVDGDVGRIAPPEYATLAAGKMRISAEALVPDKGPIQLVDALIEAEALRLGARGWIDPDAERLDLSYDLRAVDSSRLGALLPNGYGWASLALLGTAKGPIDYPAIDVTVDAGGLRSPQGGAETARVALKATPTAPLSSPAARIAAVVDANADGVRFPDDRMMFSVGRSFVLSAAGTTDLNGAADIERSEVRLANARATYAGLASPEALKGKATVAATDLSTLAPLVGLPVAGAVDLAADLDVLFDLSRVSALVNGSGSGLVTGVPQVDALTGGALAVKGGLTRSPDGSFAFRDFDLRGSNVTLTANGSATERNADVKLSGEISDLALVEPRAAGRATVDATLSGRLDQLGVKAVAQIADGRALDRKLQNFRIDVDATDVTGEASGTVTLAGSLDGKPISGSGRLVSEPSGVRRIESLDLDIASASVAGDVAVTPDGLATGKLAVSAPDLSEVGALALVELAGSLDSDIGLSVEGGKQRAEIRARGANIVAPGATVGAIDVAATVLDPAGRITVDGTVNGSAIAVGGQVVDRLAVTAKGAPDGMDVALDMGALGSSASALARVVYAPAETRIDLSKLDLAGGGRTAALAAPARVRIIGSEVAIDAFSLRSGEGGVLNVTGRAGERLDLTLGLRELPLALANAFTPGLGLTGMAEGDARVTGPAAAPDATFDLRVADLSISQLRDAKVPPLAIATKGRLEGQRVVTDTTVTGAGGLRVTALGSAPLGAGELDMKVGIRSLPLSIANAFASELGLSGALEGDLVIAGPLNAPRGTYQATVRDFTSAQARGVPPIQIAARGVLEGNRVTTDTDISGGGGIKATARGSAPIGDGDLDMTVAIREFPLALANGFAPDLGLGGTLRGDARVSGPLARPVGTYDLRIVDLVAAQAAGLPALQITAKGALEGQRATTDASITGGGGLSLVARGSAPIGPGDLDMTIAIRELPLAVANNFAPDLGLAGMLRGDARIFGPLATPRGTYALRISDLTATPGRGAPPVQIQARGALEGLRVTTDATLTGADGLSIAAKGSAPVAEGDLDLDFAIGEVPLKLANLFMPDLGLGGMLRGSAKATGPVAAPRVAYDLNIQDLTTTQARGVPALRVDTKGALEGDRVTTDTTVTGGGGIEAVVRGSAPLLQGELDLTATIREFPLALANAFDPRLGLGGVARGDVKVSGPMDAPRGTYDLRIVELVSAQAKGVPALEVVTRGDLEGDRVTTDTSVTGGGGLSLVARGSAPLGEGDLDMTVGIRELPLALANSFRPELGLAGTLRGDARVTGPVARPVGTYDLRITGLTAAQAKGVPALEVATKGDLQGDRVTTDTSVTGGGGISLIARGSAPIGEGDLDMTVAISELPLAIANNFRPELGLAGTLRGDARVTGPVARPVGTYNLRITGLTAAQAKGVPALEITTKGDLQGDRVTTDTSVIGGGGISLVARGSAPIGEGDLDMTVGIRDLPLAIANNFKPELGLAGTLRGDARVTGPIMRPVGTYDVKISGLTTAQARGVPALEIAAKGDLQGDRVTTDATVSGGGGIALSARGSAPLAAGDLDMDVTVKELPLALANAFSPQLGLGGALRGAAKVNGPVTAPRGTYDIAIVNLTSAQARGVPPLQIAARGALEGNRVTTDTSVTGGGGIRATARGSAPIGAGDLDMTVDVAALPLALANGFSPGVGLGGTLAGSARVGGPVAAPQGTYDVRIANLTAAAAKGVPALQIVSRGDMAGGRVTTDTAVTGGGGLRITAKGSAPITAGNLDLAVEIRNAPLALANGFSPGLGANGALQGEAKIGGTIAAPTGTYNLRVTNLSTAATRSAGVPVAQINSTGRLEGTRIVTDTVVTAARGLRVTAQGSAPLGAGNLDLSIAGRAPLGFLNDTLSVTGDRIDGTASFDVKVGGPTSAPRINGTGQLANASYSNRASGLQLRGLAASVAANGTNIEVRSLRATTRNGGTISGSGRVAVDPAAGFPGQITFRAQNAEVVGTDIVTAITDADLSLQGPLARRPVVTGTIRTRSVEIQIPDKLPAQYTPLPNVKHRGAPAAVMRQLNAVNAGSKQAKSEEGFVATLDIDVRADNRIYIRGLGMTAEAGGQIKIAGTSANPVPVGAFELRQGRSQITVIGQRLNFTRGSVSFAGDLDPTIDFLAETKAKEITAQVLVTGTASRPKIDFTSQPVLPTDEVLARLLFKKSSGELSPSQALQLAQGLAQYTGVAGGGGGPLESVRKGLGVDTLDVTAGGEGEGPAVGVGRYISDNIYLGVRQGTTPESSQVTVDIDVTKNVKVQGEAGAAGNSAAGVAVEWDY